MSMHCAIDNNDITLLKRLILSGEDVDGMGENGQTVLQYAAYEGRVECVEVLLEAKADVNKPGGVYALTPLHLASEAGCADCVQVRAHVVVLLYSSLPWL